MLAENLVEQVQVVHQKVRRKLEEATIKNNHAANKHRQFKLF